MWKAERDPTHQAGELLNWKILGLLGGAGLVGIGVVVFLFAIGGNYGRMNADEARHLYRSALPENACRSIPVTGGLERVRRIPPDELELTLQTTAAVVEQGKKAYEYYCVHCHGPGGNGKGTVGQSFAPLPTDLKSVYVQGQTDGAIFQQDQPGLQETPGSGVYGLRKGPNGARALYPFPLRPLVCV